jgi:hypothetical protein
VRPRHASKKLPSMARLIGVWGIDRKVNGLCANGAIPRILNPGLCHPGRRGFSAQQLAAATRRRLTPSCIFIFEPTSAPLPTKGLWCGLHPRNAEGLAPRQQPIPQNEGVVLLSAPVEPTSAMRCPRLTTSPTLTSTREAWAYRVSKSLP